MSDDLLQTLRSLIDHIDEDMHSLLMKRADVIEALIKTKGTGTSGQAFRPAREAQMMQNLASRHHGILPLETVEGIWRVMIASFTYLQAPYIIHGSTQGSMNGTMSQHQDAMRDSARFHFGFTPPFQPHNNPGSVIAAVTASRGDLGLIPVHPLEMEAWWEALTPPEAPKIIARLPFLDRAGHPAGLPIFVIAKPLEQGAETLQVRLHAADQADQGERISATQNGKVLMALSSDQSTLLPCIGGHALAFQVREE
jgi:chorismate mutase